MQYKLKKQMVNVVWVSSIITPLMFSPDWFRRYELMREEDIDNANVNIGNERVSTDYGWIEITCTPTKAVFQLTRSGLESSLSDLTSSILSMFSHAETSALGVNTLYIYDFFERVTWNAIGDSLVPKALWNENNHSKILQDSPSYHYGMATLVIAIENSERKKDEIYKETINVTYAPTQNYEDVKFGIKVQYNHDISLLEGKSAVELTQFLSKNISEHISSAVTNDINSHTSMFERILS
ncbi:hypothetical protein [Pantoea eucalypti]|uniref:hypothetical protein n=1 Tax=Pantoea eucalypti TaxID=470933 RepID=UPI00289CDB55|nr:hypothetical protein [Pantoea eucalypti]